MTPRSDYVLELRRGDGAPRSMRLSPGIKLDPVSFGRAGGWVIDGSGVFDVHGYVYWDGASLFVQSADPRDPLRVNGAPISDSWTAVAAPSTIAFGDARIGFSVANDAAPSVQVRPAAGRGRSIPPAQRPPARSSVPPQRAPSRATAPPTRRPAAAPTAPPIAPPIADEDDERTRAFLPRVELPPQTSELHASDLDLDDEDDERTRMKLPAVDPSPRAAPPPSSEGDDDDHTKIVPLPTARGRVDPLPAPAPPVPVSSPMASAPIVAAPAVIVAPEVLAPARVSAPTPPPIAPSAAPLAVPPIVAVPEKKPDLLAKLRSDWSELSIPKKLILVLMPLAFVMVFLGFDDEAPPPTKKATPTAAGASKKAHDGAVADDDAPSKKHKKKRHDDEDDDEARAAPSASAATDAGAPSSADSTSAPLADAGATDAPGIDPSTSADAGPKTIERSAADAVAAGDYALALKLYKQLAKESPDDDGYKEAVRILRAKAKSDARRKKRDDE